MERVRKWGVALLLGVLGLGLVVYGVWDQIKPREVRVEIVKNEKLSNATEQQQMGQIVVDVAGGVISPGVYKLPSNSRIGDALVVAGGLSASADRSWVAANLNLAERLEDGEKVYIPSNSQISNVQITNRESSQINNKININSASVSELDRLEGIGPSRAQTIVDNRPYSKTEELVSKARIPQSVYDKISSSISVY